MIVQNMLNEMLMPSMGVHWKAEYYKNAMKSSKGEKAGGPRLPKMPQLQDFQFYNTKRLMTIFEKENAFEIFRHQLAQKEAAARAQVRLPH